MTDEQLALVRSAIAKLDSALPLISGAASQMVAALPAPDPVVTEPVQPPAEPVVVVEPPVAPVVDPVPTQPVVVPDGARYRCQTSELFQPAIAREIPPRLPGQRGRPINVGPTRTHVCWSTGWRWRNVGGDWIDRNGTPQGSLPWASITCPAATGDTQMLSADITDLVREAAARDLPLAMLITTSSRGSPRTVQTDGPDAPALVLTDSGGTYTRQPHYVGSASEVNPRAGDPSTTLPMFLEFKRPAGAVHWAVLRIPVTGQAGRPAVTLSVWLCDPDRSLPPVEEGPESPTLLGRHLYADDEPASAYIVPPEGPSWTRNIGASACWSPRMWDETADDDFGAYPHRDQGRWSNAETPHVSIVRSTDIPWGPLAPGLGALRVEIPPDPQAVEGTFARQAGLLSCDLQMPLPAHLCGRLSRIFIRYWWSWDVPPGESDSVALSDIVAVYRAKGAFGALYDPRWGEVGGKSGIVPDHACTSGGGSQTAGGGRGWQLRQSHGFPVTGRAGPLSGRMVMGYHNIDQQGGNLPGVSGYLPGWLHMGLDDAAWGRIGGALLPRTRYCIEQELLLNSVDQPGVMPDGSPHLVNGVQQHWSPDGALRTWIDGRLAFEATTAIRSLPTAKAPPGDNPAVTMYPIGDLGVRSLRLNVYTGGVTPSCKPWTQYYEGLAWSTEYIGPRI